MKRTFHYVQEKQTGEFVAFRGVGYSILELVSEPRLATGFGSRKSALTVISQLPDAAKYQPASLRSI